MNIPTHVLNWQAGWWLILLSFVTGAGIGLFFHREDFLGGYGSFRRRILRLGHIALAALGMLNVLFSYSAWPVPGTTAATVASFGFVAGGIAMPAVCFLTSWQESFRALFFIPVLALLIAVSVTIGGVP
jgi:hypothetical protein